MRTNFYCGTDSCGETGGNKSGRAKLNAGWRVTVQRLYEEQYKIEREGKLRNDRGTGKERGSWRDEECELREQVLRKQSVQQIKKKEGA